MLIVLNIVLVFLFGLTLLGLYLKSNNAVCRSKKRLDGKTAIVTGGTAGMGLQIAADFADRGARVIIASPFETEGEEARRIIVEETGNEEVIFKLLDLSSLVSIRKFVKDIFGIVETLDILINNAGVISAEKKVTEDGMNYIMQVNYFGHFLLTLLLLPLLKRAGYQSEPSRIVNVTSLAHYVGKINIERMNDTKYWYTMQFYANSKLCLILFARELTRILKESNVVINNADPGMVAGTAIVKTNNSILRRVVKFITINGCVFVKSPWEGAQTAIHVALDKTAGTVSGEMFWNCELSQASKIAYDEDLAQKVWNQSVKLVKLTNEEQGLNI